MMVPFKFAPTVTLITKNVGMYGIFMRPQYMRRLKCLAASWMVARKISFRKMSVSMISHMTLGSKAFSTTRKIALVFSDICCRKTNFMDFYSFIFLQSCYSKIGTYLYELECVMLNLVYF